MSDSDSEDIDCGPRREKFVWDSKLTTDLISLRGEHSDIFPCLKGQAATKWGKIASLLGLSKAQHKIVQKKFENLTKKYKDIINTPPNERKTWPYFEAMDAVVGSSSRNRASMIQQLRPSTSDSEDIKPSAELYDMVTEEDKQPSRNANFSWTHSLTMELIRLRGEDHNMFPCYKGEAAYKWGKIAKQLGLGSDNYHIVSKKFENLTKTYKELLSEPPNEKLGLKTRKKWPYFEAMDAVCGKEYILGLRSTQSSSENIHETPNSAKLTPVLSSTPSDELTVTNAKESCATTKSTLPTSTATRCKSIPGPSNDSDEALTPGSKTGKYFWSPELTKRLIQLRGEYSNIFPCYKGQASKKWGLIAVLLGLEKDDYGIVAKKFENLTRKYRNLLNPSLSLEERNMRQRTWPYFHSMQALLENADRTTKSSVDFADFEWVNVDSWQEEEEKDLEDTLQEMETDSCSSFKEVESEELNKDNNVIEQTEVVPTLTQSAPVQLDGLCRMCAESSVANSSHLLSSSTTLLYQLMHYFGIDVMENDGLPASICECCKNELDHIEQLKLTVARAQHFLKQKLEVNQQNTDKTPDNIIVDMNKSESDLEVFDENSDHELLNVPSTSNNLGISNEDVEQLLATQCTVLVDSDFSNDELGDVEISSDIESNSGKETSLSVEISIKNSSSTKSKIQISNPATNKIETKKRNLLQRVSKRSVLKVNVKNMKNCGKKYTCRICNATYSSIKNWIVHFQTCHKDVDVCENIKKFKMHDDANKIFTENSYVDSPIVEDETSNDTEIIKKVKPRKKRKVRQSSRFSVVEDVSHYSCDICNCKHFSPEQLYNHFLEKHVSENQLNCEFCTKYFEKPDELLQHLKKHALTRKYFCPICDKNCYSQSNMAKHIDCHSTDRNHQCSECGKTYRTSVTLYSHIKCVHGNNVKRYMCEHCSQMFQNKTKIKYHIQRAHSEQKPCVCDICGKGFLTEFQVKQHKYVHSEFRPYHCVKCNRGFIGLTPFRRHMRRKCNIPESEIVYFTTAKQKIY